MSTTLRSILTATLVAVLGVAGLILWQERTLLSPSALQTLLAEHPWAPLAYLGLHLLVSLLFIPRTIMAVAAGLIFGLWWGTLWATLGAMIGAWAGFLIARLLGEQFFHRGRMPRLTAMIERVERGGWRAVWLLRLLPLPHTPLNFAFGLTRIDWLSYSIGSFLGVLPSTIAAAAFGAAGGQAIDGHGISWAVPTAVGLIGVAVSFALPKLPQLRGR
jgi:uncharacterized membrane protein YdjX (TVP38/TMEM64 family)